jgi:putative pyruvate formate lyase activating enzyme
MECEVDRIKGEEGNCCSGTDVRVASYNLHFGEEPPLSGGGGSGTIFFSNCPLLCKYCQNYPISQMGTGSIASIGELKDMMLSLQKRGAENINWVTPDHVMPMALRALGEARREGLTLPLVYNCSGYEKVEILRNLEGITDIYLVDMRYNDDNPALIYSGCKDYTHYNKAAVKEMYRQVGNMKLNNRGLAVSGVIIRHLVLPEGISGSEGIFRFLAEEVSPDIYVSLMSQYFPAYKALNHDDIARRITPDEFRQATGAFYSAGLKNGYIQEMEHEAV